MSLRPCLGDSRGMQHTASPIRVFLADDSALSRRRVAEMLTAQGMVITGQANTPQSAVSGILATQPDVVVLDVQFENGTGMQVLQAVFKTSPTIPFIILSNHAEPAYRARYLAAGALQFLDKSSEFNELGEAAVRLARLQRSGRSISSLQPQEPLCP
ncbi:response regulator [Polaromonas sp. SP1]|nr:response regulator [Polaromonas sp. SP1]QGJ19374.1 response regulator [Polaromonas sp. Pch-P]